MVVVLYPSEGEGRTCMECFSFSCTFGSYCRV